jgi:hypothetical protein
MFERDSHLASIRSAAFDGCVELTSISLPPGLRELGQTAFPWTSLRSFAISPGNRSFSVAGDYVLDFAGISLVGHLGPATVLCIPNTVEVFCPGCFGSRKDLCSVTFERDSHLREMGEKALACCRSLKYITIPTTVEMIGEGCFRYCMQLSSVIFESGSKLSHIGAVAFTGCSSLASIVIPGNVETIGEDCFTDRKSVV